MNPTYRVVPFPSIADSLDEAEGRSGIFGEKIEELEDFPEPTAEDDEKFRAAKVRRSRQIAVDFNVPAVLRGVYERRL